MSDSEFEEGCPKCGCKELDTTGNMVEYPEIWQEWYCVDCGWLVQLADNSPTYHCRDFPDYVIDI